MPQPVPGDAKRIVVALDTGSLSGVAIDAAARLAAGLHAELQALFVEDSKLRRLADLPFARELGNMSAQHRRFDAAELDRAIRVQARQLRHALEAAARERPLIWSLEVVRGDLIAVLLEHTSAADLVVLGRTRRPAYLGVRVPTVARRIERLAMRHPVVAVFDGTAAATRALDAALALERRSKGELVVAIRAPQQEQIAALRAQVDAALAVQRRAASEYLWLQDAGIANIAETAKRRRAGVVLLPVADLARAEHEFEGLVDEIACPVVLIP
ncbi:MAG: hypothetical protein A3G25_05570 [Betaproteobacteria bacterium RIFCSPLOWO2_12_FULL_63_13]|nr:MAG: hypothetical protein A3G25_05570 [Betaproteobacteria bacterium RIFCSPLOWO2_12_FULL_63_13]